MYEKEKQQALAVITEFLESAKLKENSVLVIGCSSSEIVGEHIGKGSTVEAAQAVFNVIYPVLCQRKIYLAAQCCEHLNRALIIEEELADRLGLEKVNVVPQIKAGGSFATTAYGAFKNPVAVEHIKADAGFDIGDTLIGMHLKDVAVPVRLSVSEIGQAHVVAARTRRKFIGGERAHYDEALK